MALTVQAYNNSRTFKTRPILGIKSVEESGKIAGYATVFDVLDLQNDIARAGAFKDLRPELVALLWSHSDTEPIGKITDIKEDAKGVYFEALLCLEVKRARELYIMLKERVFTGVSIGWIPFELVANEETGARYINSGHIFEISLVVTPANEEARVTHVKSDAGNINENPEDLKLLRAVNKALKILAA